jgi:hypothetical protein
VVGRWGVECKCLAQDGDKCRTIVERDIELRFTSRYHLSVTKFITTSIRVNIKD